MTYPDYLDQPGRNTVLRPEAAPAWLRPLTETPDTDAIRRTLGVKPGVRPRRDKQAAVLMLFAGARDAPVLPADAGVLLTHRAPTMRTHSGQMAFPGGRIDATDDNVVDTALREAWEETGLRRDSVTPIAQLPEMHVRSNGYPVHPIIAYWDEPEELYPASEEETDDVFTASIEELADPASRLTVGWGPWRGPAFQVRGYVVWGFTGGLLSSALAAAGWEDDWDRDTVHDLSKILAASRNNESMG